MADAIGSGAVFTPSKVVVLAAAMLASVAGCRSEPQAPKRPDIILISLDTLRARSLGTYGHHRRTSPFFDRLAAQAVLFEAAMTTSVTTGPSHMSLLTGAYPRSHGVRQGVERKAVPADMPMLATVLKGAGYKTKAITENGFIIRAVGFDEGFDEYDEHFGPHRRSAPGLVEESFKQAAEWIEGEHDAPYFLFVHTYEVHSPYQPPRRFNALFHNDGKRRTRLEDRYDREIAYLDEELERLFDVIIAAKRERGMLVIVVSDHGEEFFEHAVFQHGTHVFDESIHVPLLFWGEGVPTPRRVPGQVSIIDVVPTLLDLLDIPIPDAVEGESLEATIVDGSSPPSRPIFAEAMSRRRLAGPKAYRMVEPPQIAVRFDRRKFIAHRPSKGERNPTVMFDLEKDPFELNPLPVDSAESDMIEKLVDDYLTSGGKGGAEEVSEEDFTREADPALVERLRSLGYIE